MYLLLVAHWGLTLTIIEGMAIIMQGLIHWAFIISKEHLI
jgi:hypothetical protein